MIQPQQTVQKVALDVKQNQEGQFYYTFKGSEKIIEDIKPISQATLTKEALTFAKQNGQTLPEEEFVKERQNSHSFQTVPLQK